MNRRIKTDITSEILSAADVKTFIKYDDTDAAEIVLIDDMITTVRAYLEKRLDISFAERTYEVFFKSDESPFILPIYPVISIDKVETVDIEGDKTELELNSGYYKLWAYEIEIKPSSLQDPFGESDRLSLLVTCKAGYGHSDTQDIPGDLLGALKSQVFQWYENRDDFYEGTYLGMIDKVIRLHRRIW